MLNMRTHSYTDPANGIFIKIFTIYIYCVYKNENGTEIADGRGECKKKNETEYRSNEWKMEKCSSVRPIWMSDDAQFHAQQCSQF